MDVYFAILAWDVIKSPIKRGIALALAGDESYRTPLEVSVIVEMKQGVTYGTPEITDALREMKDIGAVEHHRGAYRLSKMWVDSMIEFFEKESVRVEKVDDSEAYFKGLVERLKKAGFIKKDAEIVNGTLKKSDFVTGKG
ncbi:MAG: hypothetical protein V1676_00050 [Candidatus Diapherotrites archaeon]